MTTYDFARMTLAEALDALVEMDVARWGEAERDASRRLHRGLSRGRLINRLVHHEMHEYGDIIDAETKRVAEQQLEESDWAELRRGG